MPLVGFLTREVIAHSEEEVITIAVECTDGYDFLNPPKDSCATFEIESVRHITVGNECRATVNDAVAKLAFDQENIE